MTLALVIPVHNDQRHLDRLLAQAQRLGVFDQIIICDDGSEPPVTLRDDRPGPLRCPVTILRRAQAAGAGVARNQALSHVSADHVLFFDSDDLFTEEFPHLWRDLAGRTFDFCQFRHQDSERGFFGGWGQIPHDESRWRLAGADRHVLGRLTGPRLWTLAETGNFPWNKVYRTRFLLDNGLRCGETRVHNDIELHWGSFLAAGHVLTSNRIAAIHVVRPGATRLTNRSGRERLQVFGPLRNVAAKLIRHSPDDGAMAAFLRFASGLMIWIDRVIAPALRPEFHRRMRGFLLDVLSPALHARLSREDPVLALRLCLQAGLGDDRAKAPVPCG